MIIELSIIALILLKLFGVVQISWTLTITFVVVLIVVEINSVMERKRMMAVIHKLATAVDRKVDDLEFDIEQVERHRKYREERDWD